MHSRKNSDWKKMLVATLVFAFFGLAMMSCNNPSYYEHDEAIKNNIWCYEDAKAFEFEIKDSLLAFNFYINVRNTVDYEFANLYFFIQSELPDGSFAQDTVECQLADYRGKWLGEGRGQLRDNSFILRKNMRFQKNGKYRFLLKQGMRRDSLKGISDVGIRLENVN